MTFDFDHTKTETQNFQAALDEIERLQLRDAAMQAQIVADVRQQAEQAVSLDAAEALIRKNAETINKQAKQIATLKASLMGRDLRLLKPCNGECGKNNIQPEDCDQCEHDYVISQLAKEYPEIFAEEKK